MTNNQTKALTWISAAVLGAALGWILGGCSSSSCPTGQFDCGNVCVLEGYMCCSNYSACPPNTECGGNGNCAVNASANAKKVCKWADEQTCSNDDGVTDCIPLGADCCHDHHFCVLGTCAANGTCDP